MGILCWIHAPMAAVLLLLYCCCCHSAISDGCSSEGMAVACRIHHNDAADSQPSQQPSCMCQNATKDFVVPEGSSVLLACGTGSRSAPSHCLFKNNKTGSTRRGTISQNPKAPSILLSGITSRAAGSRRAKNPACLTGVASGCFLHLPTVDKETDGGDWECHLKELDLVCGDDNSDSWKRVIGLQIADKCDPTLNNSDCQTDKFCHPTERVCQEVCFGIGGEKCTGVEGAVCVPNSDHGFKCFCNGSLAGVYDNAGSLIRCRPVCKSNEDCQQPGQQCRSSNYAPPVEERKSTCMSTCEKYSCPGANECQLPSGSCISHATCSQEDLEGIQYGCKCIEGYTPDTGNHHNFTRCIKICNTHLDCFDALRKETCVDGQCLETCSVSKCGFGTACIPQSNGTRICQCNPGLFRVDETSCNVPVPPYPWHPIVWIGHSQICSWPANDTHPITNLVRWCWVQTAIEAGTGAELFVQLNNTFPQPSITFFSTRGPADAIPESNMKRDHDKDESHVTDNYAKFKFTPKPEDHRKKIGMKITHLRSDGTARVINVIVELNIFGCHEKSDCTSDLKVCKVSRTDFKKKCIDPCSEEIFEEACLHSTSVCTTLQNGTKIRTCDCPEGFQRDEKTGPHTCTKRCAKDSQCEKDEECARGSEGAMVCLPVCLLHECPENSLCKPTGDHNFTCPCEEGHYLHKDDGFCYPPVPPYPLHPNLSMALIGLNESSEQDMCLVEDQALWDDAEMAYGMHTPCFRDLLPVGSVIQVTCKIYRTFPAPRGVQFGIVDSRGDVLQNFTALANDEGISGLEDESSLLLTVDDPKRSNRQRARDFHYTTSVVIMPNHTNNSFRCYAELATGIGRHQQMAIEATSLPLRVQTPEDEKWGHVITLEAIPSTNVTLGSSLELICETDLPLLPGKDFAECNWLLINDNNPTGIHLAFHGSTLNKAFSSLVVSSAEVGRTWMEKARNCNIRLNMVKPWMAGNWSCLPAWSNKQLRQNDSLYLTVTLQGSKAASSFLLPRKMVIIASSGGTVLAVTLVLVCLAILHWALVIKRGKPNPSSAGQQTEFSIKNPPAYPTLVLVEESVMRGQRSRVHRTDDWSRFRSHLFSSIQFLYTFNDRAEVAEEDHVYEEIQICTRPLPPVPNDDETHVNTDEVEPAAGILERKKSASSPCVL